MKTLNYIICSVVLFIGIILLCSDNIILIIAAFLWGLLNYKLSTIKQVRLMWRKFWKTNLEIERYFGV